MTRIVRLPGDVAAADLAATADPEDKDALIAQLRAELAAKAVEPKLPSVVYEPVTPHGKAAKEASAFAHLTCAELMAKIDAGEAKEPFIGVLCSDGYYCKRG